MSEKKGQNRNYRNNLNGDENDSMKHTLGTNLSENSFNVKANKRGRVKSAYVRNENIEEIQEEAFDSINIKTAGGNFTDHE